MNSSWNGSVSSLKCGTFGNINTVDCAKISVPFSRKPMASFFDQIKKIGKPISVNNGEEQYTQK